MRNGGGRKKPLQPSGQRETCARNAERDRWRECCASKATAENVSCCARFARRSGNSAEFIARIAAKRANSRFRYLLHRNFRRFVWKLAIRAGTAFAAWT